MEVTRHNFRSKLEEVEEAIDSCSFLSIDGEFTGLNAFRGISPFDLPFQRYDKLQESARQFLLVQFGLCTFHYDSRTDTFTNQAYNFYVWPRPCSRQAPDPRFLCQTSSVDFLIGQGFDFNKLFRDGISYLRPAELERLKASARERQDYRLKLSLTPVSNDDIPIPPEQEAFLKEVHDKVDKFLGSEALSLELSRCNAFQRRLVYQTGQNKYPSLSFSSITKTGGERVIAVVKADESERRRLENLKNEAELTDLDEAFGFSHIIKRISESKKLVVGHNMALDVCYTLNQFYAPLPDTYEEFKAMTSTILPNILDTKLMANTIPFKEEIANSALEELMKTVSETPYTMPPVPPRRAGCGYQLSSDKYHEAGYDAYVTGLCFIAMARRLAKLCGSTDMGVSADSAHISPFLNKLYLMKIADIPYINLAGEDLMPDRSHVFHLEFPPEWKTPDIVHLFSPFGNVTVIWINDFSAFVALRDKSAAATVLEVLQSSSMYVISSFDRYMERCRENDQQPPTALRMTAAAGSDVTTVADTTTNTGITPMLERSFTEMTGRVGSPGGGYSMAAGQQRRFGTKSAAANKPLTVDCGGGASIRGGARERPSAATRQERGRTVEATAPAAAGKRRPVSPSDAQAVDVGVKRSKSVTEEAAAGGNNKAFEEPPWE